MALILIEQTLKHKLKSAQAKLKMTRISLQEVISGHYWPQFTWKVYQNM